jgi:quercetin dioxygenase-like cupin family protein
MIDLSKAADDARVLGDGDDRRAITLAHEPGTRLVMLRLRGGTELAEHATSGPTTIQVLEGEVRFVLDGGPAEATAGQLVVLAAGARHGVIAVRDSTLLLTIGNAIPGG